MALCGNTAALNGYLSDEEEAEIIQDAIEVKTSEFVDLMLNSEPWDKRMIVGGVEFNINDFISDVEIDGYIIASFLNGDVLSSEKLRSDLLEKLDIYCSKLAEQAVKDGE